MKNLHIIEHPLVQHKLSMLRDQRTGSKEFRELANEIAMLMGYEATRDLPLEESEVQTPLETCKVKVLAGKKLAAVVILRAGLSMVDGILQLVPAAKVGHIGIYRDTETLAPVEYYCKLPSDIAEREVILLDPMIATGGTASAAVQFIKNYGARSIKFVSIIAAPDGIQKLCRDHPDVEVLCASIDRGLNDHGYIEPGLGDFGDRVFGTK